MSREDWPFIECIFVRKIQSQTCFGCIDRVCESKEWSNSFLKLIFLIKKMSNTYIYFLKIKLFNFFRYRLCARHVFYLQWILDLIKCSTLNFQTDSFLRQITIKRACLRTNESGRPISYVSNPFFLFLYNFCHSLHAHPSKEYITLIPRKFCTHRFGRQ